MSQHITLEDFRNLMVNSMGFHEFERSYGEIIWQKTIPATSLAIRVCSGLDKSGKDARNLGIRLYVVDIQTMGAVLPMMRVRRTPNALRNIRGKIGLLWKQALTIKA